MKDERSNSSIFLINRLVDLYILIDCLSKDKKVDLFDQPINRPLYFRNRRIQRLNNSILLIN